MALQLLIAVITAISGLVIWLDLSVKREQRRELQTVADAACRACNTPYGLAAAEQAKDDHLRRSRKAREDRPNARINFSPDWQIRCIRCGASARVCFDEGRVTFAPL